MRTNVTDATTQPGYQLREIWIPIESERWVSMRGFFPMTEAAWNQMLVVLNAMKPALVDTADMITARGILSELLATKSED